MGGDADLSRIGELLADRTRSRILMALSAGREASASLLAAEAGVTRSTTSEHLRRLTEGGLIAVRTEGRHRHYRLAGPEVANLLEVLAQLSPPEPVTSLRSSTRAARLRLARTCYDHLAGQLGVGIMATMIERGHLTGGDGIFDPATAGEDRPAAHGRDLDYQLTPDGQEFLDRLGVQLSGGSRPVVRYCVDWTETRHHLAGQVGRGLCARLVEVGWIERHSGRRDLVITRQGHTALQREFDLVLSRP